MIQLIKLLVDSLSRSNIILGQVAGGGGNGTLRHADCQATTSEGVIKFFESSLAKVSKRQMSKASSDVEEVNQSYHHS